MKKSLRITRMKVRDVAFAFRMGAGFPGEVNRTHPVTIEPCLISAASPPTAFGQAVLLAAANAGVRPLVAGDVNVTSTFGVTVRPYPYQQSSGTDFGTANLGAGTPPTTGVTDVLRSGYIMVKIPAGQTPAKGDPVYVWTAASTGVHVQGGFEAVVDHGTNTTPALTGVTFNGPPDAQGNVEICFNV